MALQTDKTIIIHFDMDGTLAEWKDLIPDIKKMLIKEGHDIQSIEDIMQTKETITEKINTLIRRPGYFYDLMPYQNVVDFAKLLIKQGYDVRICSCAPTKRAISDKKFWLEDFIPEIKNTKYHAGYLFIEDGQGKDKALKISDLNSEDTFHVLIDDHTPNCVGFTEALLARGAYGCAIKMFNEVNGKNGRWQGDSLSNNMNPEQMCRQFEKIIEKNLELSDKQRIQKVNDQDGVMHEFNQMCIEDMLKYEEERE